MTQPNHVTQTTLEQETPVFWDAFSGGLEVQEDNLGFVISFPNDFRIDSIPQLFHLLRYAMSQHMNGRFLSIKYAALISSRDIPVIHDPDPKNICFYYDPLCIFRDTAAYANRSRSIRLQRFDSSPAYYRKRTQHQKGSHGGSPTSGSEQS